MATSKRRDRSVIFRVNEQEYDSLKSACEAAGHRSLSDYTRSELLGTRIDSSDSCLLERLREIDRKLTEVCQLAIRMLESMRANGANLPDDKFEKGLAPSRIVTGQG